MDVWIINKRDDGRIELIAPNGVVLMAVSRETAAMVGQILIDAADLGNYNEEEAR